MRRRGSVLVTVALATVLLLVFAALAIDLSRLRNDRVELQNAADAASHAGARMLDGTTAGMESARTMAQTIAAANEVSGREVTLDPNAANAADGDIVLGRWSGGAFVADVSDPQRVAAVQVRAARDDLDGWFAAAALGRQELGASAIAVAVSGGPTSADCPLPITVPSCAMDGEDFCTLELQMSPDNNDNAAWAKLGTDRPSAQDVKDALLACSLESQTGDVVTLNNGAITSAAKAVADAIDASSQTWDAAEWGAQPAQLEKSSVSSYGNVIKSELILFEDPSDCTDPKMNGTGLPIAGFATAVIYDVVATGNPDDRTVALRVVCDKTTERGGGGFYGTVASPQLVQ